MSSDLMTALRERGLRVTSQRVIVHRALREIDRHVTADELLDAVQERLPGVALPTIYATLELFEELGMVRRVHRSGGAATLFDPRTEPHHHVQCTRCGRIEDVEGALGADGLLAAAGALGFAPERVEALVHGRCADCAAA
jgi:Fe2+ or Zn2+ uptake regulation protein